MGSGTTDGMHAVGRRRHGSRSGHRHRRWPCTPPLAPRPPIPGSGPDADAACQTHTPNHISPPSNTRRPVSGALCRPCGDAGPRRRRHPHRRFGWALGRRRLCQRLPAGHQRAQVGGWARSELLDPQPCSRGWGLLLGGSNRGRNCRSRDGFVLCRRASESRPRVAEPTTSAPIERAPFVLVRASAARAHTHNPPPSPPPPPPPPPTSTPAPTHPHPHMRAVRLRTRWWTRRAPCFPKRSSSGPRMM